MTPRLYRRRFRRLSAPAVLGFLALALTVVACSSTIQGSARTAAGALVSAHGPAGSSGPGTSVRPPATSGASASVEPTDIVLDPNGVPTTPTPYSRPTPPLQRLPNLPPVGPQATATIGDDGVITISKGKPKLVVDEYQDPLCPPCGAFWQQYGVELTRAIADGKLTLRLHSVNFLDDKSASGDYSTRADGTLLTVVHLGSADQVILWETALYSAMVQPRENDSADITSDEFGDLATMLGLGQPVTDSMAQEEYVDDAADAAGRAYAALTSTGARGVPATFVGHRQIDASRPTWIKELIGG